MVSSSASRPKRTARVPYASAADALRIKGARRANGTYRDRRDVEPLPGCDCQSYVDILTAGRWRALGYSINAGEQAHFHGGKVKSIPLFCRCQVHLRGNTDYLATLAPCSACEEPAELDSNGLCADCAGFAAPSDMEPEPEPASVLVPSAAGPAVVAEATGAVNGVPIVRTQLVRERVAELPGEISAPDAAAQLFRTFIGDHDDREHVLLLALDTKNRPLGLTLISMGSLNSSIVRPADVFKPATLLGAAAIVVAHNHPSGDPTPSAEDVSVTRKLRECGQLLDIELLDHIVLGHGGTPFVSMRERGLGF